LTPVGASDLPRLGSLLYLVRILNYPYDKRHSSATPEHNYGGRRIDTHPVQIFVCEKLPLIQIQIQDKFVVITVM